MKNFIYNIGYFIKESRTIFRLNFWSNILSLFSIGLILFILSLVISGWRISTEVITLIQNEAEVSIYTDENMDEKNLLEVINQINEIEGILEVQAVKENEAYARMVDVLGEDAKVLKFFDDNPFNSFIEAKIDIQNMEYIYKELKQIPKIDYIRDNREVLERLRNITKAFRILGTLFIAAVGISTVIIISHIIRQGIYNSKEEINTLRLLGASEVFISSPFLIVGLILTVGGGLFAGVLSYIVLIQIYSQIVSPLPFIPLPSMTIIIRNLILMILSISTFLGVSGSLIGLSSAKKGYRSK